MKNKKLFLSIIGGVVVVLFFIFVVPVIFKKDEWTLMVCKSKLNNSECYENSYEIAGFSSAKECLLSGAREFSKEGFECCKNLWRDKYGLNVCKEICNADGCTE